jgi:cytochrome c oxidase cbb3-type subunit 2
MIRTLRDEVDRYGPFSLAVESKYDHPMLWGSKRTGPDLARVGQKYSDQWQTAHLTNPRSLVPASLMPAYPWLNTAELNAEVLRYHLKANIAVGVPYTQEMVDNAAADAIAQASPGSDAVSGLVSRYGEKTTISVFDGNLTSVTEMDALVAYLQILGRLTEAAHSDTTTNGGGS